MILSWLVACGDPEVVPQMVGVLDVQGDCTSSWVSDSGVVVVSTSEEAFEVELDGLDGPLAVASIGQSTSVSVDGSPSRILAGTRVEIAQATEIEGLAGLAYEDADSRDLEDAIVSVLGTEIGSWHHCTGESVRLAPSDERVEVTRLDCEADPFGEPLEPLVDIGCEEVTAQSRWCLTVSWPRVVAIGLDDGRSCPVVEHAQDVEFSGLVASGSTVFGCSRPYGNLAAIDLETGAVTHTLTPCWDVAVWEDELVVFPLDGGTAMSHPGFRSAGCTAGLEAELQTTARRVHVVDEHEALVSHDVASYVAVTQLPDFAGHETLYLDTDSSIWGLGGDRLVHLKDRILDAETHDSWTVPTSTGLVCFE